MTLVEESAMKQSTMGRHCEERSDEAIQKSTTFWIASSLALLAMTMRRKTVFYKKTHNFHPFDV
jgi:hypothetical protein